ncbi:MAG: hypothetical protein ACMXX9_04330 [Candidatus Woesearchaeota archaeon]
MLDEQIRIAKQIVQGTTASKHKEYVEDTFNNTNNKNKDDLTKRLVILDTLYSTNMSKRLFAFQDLTQIILDVDDDIEQLDEITLMQTYLNENHFLKPVGIDKHAKPKGHAFSLLSKYLFFRSDKKIPIYDSLVYTELKDDFDLKKTQKPTTKYFEILKNIKEKNNVTYEDLDVYYWVKGKIRKNNYSMLAKDKQEYQDILNKKGQRYELIKKIKL